MLALINQREGFLPTFAKYLQSRTTQVLIYRNGYYERSELLNLQPRWVFFENISYQISHGFWFPKKSIDYSTLIDANIQSLDRLKNPLMKMWETAFPTNRTANAFDQATKDIFTAREWLNELRQVVKIFEGIRWHPDQALFNQLYSWNPTPLLPRYSALIQRSSDIKTDMIQTMTERYPGLQAPQPSAPSDDCYDSPPDSTKIRYDLPPPPSAPPLGIYQQPPRLGNVTYSTQPTVPSYEVL